MGFFKKESKKDSKKNSKIDIDLFVRKSKEELLTFKGMKESLENKVLQNEKWFKSQYWGMFENKNTKQLASNNPEPTTAYLFNTLINKHSDMMDNFPTPIIYPRQQDDEAEAEKLTKIIPLVLQKNKFKQKYSKNSWSKLKNGLSIYGVFWNNDLEDGLGDIDIKRINVLNIYWDISVEDIQDSRAIYIAHLIDDDILQKAYPEKLKDMKEVQTVDLKHYEHEDNIEYKNKSVVVDMYYKKINSQGKKIVHLAKFVGDVLLESTEFGITRDDIKTNYDYSDVGLYDHGKYPIIVDVAFPDEDTSVGFGYIDIIKNPQMYIDKLDQIIIKNAYLSGKTRFIVNKNNKIPIEDLGDFSKEIIESEGKITSEDIFELKVSPLPDTIVNHRDRKINELKEISSTNESSRGETPTGITAASAIVALQEAGNKVSRDLIQESYSSYNELIYLVIELIRQFYTESRTFRIVDSKTNKKEYIEYNNSNLSREETVPAIDENSQNETIIKKAIFDIDVKVEKQNPYVRAETNALAKEFYSSGFFAPENAQQALMALDMMDFDNKQDIVNKISQNNQIQQQMTQMAQTLAQQQQIISKYGKVLEMQSNNNLDKRTIQPAQQKMYNNQQLSSQNGDIGFLKMVKGENE